jgi:kynureninase
MSSLAATSPFRTDEAFAREMDAGDPLSFARGLFHIPRAPAEAGGGDAAYMTGNSLGLMPKAARAAVDRELEDWAELAVDAHLQGRDPWLAYHESLREPTARLVGALPDEVVMMNSLTGNLHLLLVTFYRPARERFKIIIEDTAFPSDSYAVASQIRFHGLDPRQALVRIKPREGELFLRTQDIEATLEREGKRTALVMLGAVNYLTGQWFEMERITAAARRQGCVVGWDLAHAAGNVPMRLHDWGVDFAAWCTYKYLNSGPGAVAGAFIHERHAKSFDLPRFTGWWGNDPQTRFVMRPEFAPRQDADGWQLSNPPIFSMAPVKASMEIFDRVGMAAIREKSLKLTGYLEFLLDQQAAGHVQIVTPRDPAARGAQLSLRLPGIGKEAEQRLRGMGVYVDFREPDIIRVAPAPLYNTFRDVWRLAQALETLNEPAARQR